MIEGSVANKHSWISLIWRPPGPISLPVALGGICATWALQRKEKREVQYSAIVGSCGFLDSLETSCSHRHPSNCYLHRRGSFCKLRSISTSKSCVLWKVWTPFFFVQVWITRSQDRTTTSLPRLQWRAPSQAEHSLRSLRSVPADFSDSLLFHSCIVVSFVCELIWIRSFHSFNARAFVLAILLQP